MDKETLGELDMLLLDVPDGPALTDESVWKALDFVKIPVRAPQKRSPGPFTQTLKKIED